MILSADWIYFLLPILAFSLNVFVQIIFYRLLFSRSGAILKSVFVGYVSGLVLLAILYITLDLPLSTSERVIYALSNSVFYSCLWYCFFHYVNIGQASLRIRMLIELQNHAAGMAKEDLLKKYNNRSIVATRLHRLVSSEQVVQINNRYYLGKPRFTLIMGFFKILSKIVWGAGSPINENRK